MELWDAEKSCKELDQRERQLRSSMAQVSEEQIEDPVRDMLAEAGGSMQTCETSLTNKNPWPPFPPDYWRELASLTNKNYWPSFPKGYWRELREAHLRWGARGRKSRKYEILPYHGDIDMLRDWFIVRFTEWMDVRKLQTFMTFEQRWWWQCSYDHNTGCSVFKYKYHPPTRAHQESHPEKKTSHPVMKEAKKRCDETITTYHGT